jgi:endonuclease/exonuclease/phosphatase family metal-dependent hydrolase
MAQIIEGNFDIVAIVEVMQKEEGHPGYHTLLSALGAGWNGMVTDHPRPYTTAGDAEFYAIMYRTNAIRPCTGWASLIYHHDNDGSENGTGPDHFSREPAFGCFQVPAIGPTVVVDFLLAAYHARWADGNKSKIKGEVRHIEQVFASMAAARTGEHDLFIAGDFNLVPEDLRQVVSVLVDTQGTGSTLNLSGDRTTNLYDHILVHDHVATQERLGPPQVIDVIGAAASPREFYRTLSDHLPVLMQLRASGPDDD